MTFKHTVNSLDKEEIQILQQKLYDYFHDGYAFEAFLKEYLIKIGLDEVSITPKTRDGGFDLKAIRKGLGDFSNIDITRYYIQAKRYKLDNKIGVKVIRELKGTIPFGEKGMLITTSDFTQDAIIEASNDPSKPVILINGRTLIESCIDNQIGFIFKPVFSKDKMDLFIKKNSFQKNAEKSKFPNMHMKGYVEKIITRNDVRARIISIPSDILASIPLSLNEINVFVTNNSKKYIFRINRERKFLSGVTDLLKEFELLSPDGIITPKNAIWTYSNKDKSNSIIFSIEDN